MATKSKPKSHAAQSSKKVTRPAGASRLQECVAEGRIQDMFHGCWALHDHPGLYRHSKGVEAGHQPAEGEIMVSLPKGAHAVYVRDAEAEKRLRAILGHA